jgi:hypothetical protein
MAGAVEGKQAGACQPLSLRNAHASSDPVRIVSDDESVISENVIACFDKGNDPLEEIGLSLEQAKTVLAGAQTGSVMCGWPPACKSFFEPRWNACGHVSGLSGRSFDRWP